MSSGRSRIYLFIWKNSTDADYEYLCNFKKYSQSINRNFPQHSTNSGFTNIIFGRTRLDRSIRFYSSRSELYTYDSSQADKSESYLVKKWHQLYLHADNDTHCLSLIPSKALTAQTEQWPLSPPHWVRSSHRSSPGRADGSSLTTNRTIHRASRL